MSHVLNALKRATPLFLLLIALAIILGIMLPSLQRAKRNANALPPGHEYLYGQPTTIDEMLEQPEQTASAPGSRPRQTVRSEVLESRKSVAADSISGSAGVSANAFADVPGEQRDVTLSQYDPSDELWVIVEPEHVGAADDDPDAPGSGALVAMVGDDRGGPTERVPVPLEHTEVAGSITGHVASVNVKQTFVNPHQTKIEAVYVFPLPDHAAVNGFLMTVGDRTIRGVIREREEAERIYAQARSRGHVASLLHQQRPNIFMQKVANIEPGKSIDIDITYFHTMTFADGWFEYVFPMVVGPRYNPASTLASGDGVAATGRGPVNQSGQATEVQYLRPDERSGHDIGLTLEVNAGFPIEDIVSLNHRIEKLETDDGACVRLARDDSIPNKDFVLRYRVAGEAARSGVVVVRDGEGDGGYFTAMLMPPLALKRQERTPLELIFVLDCSGSMNGRPLAQSKLAMRTALERLEPYDTFQVIRFSSDASSLGARPLAASAENIQRALAYVDGLRGHGGTEMIEGVKAALDFPHDEGHLRFVTFLTDGYIGNERDILRAMDERIGDSRVFSFGVGSSPNRYLMDRMATLGRGASAYISLQSDGDEVMDAFFDRIAHPAMTNVAVDFGPLRGVDAYPSALPDLFTGRPVIVTGRFESGYDAIARGEEAITFSGDIAGERRSVSAALSGAPAPGDSALNAVWARAKIKGLATAIITAKDRQRRSLVDEIESVALANELMSDYTSFVAVDSSEVTDGDIGYTVAVPVPVPDGVRYDTTVQSAVHEDE